MKNSSTRAMVIIFTAVIGITTFFLVFGYYNQLKLYEDAAYNKLNGIAITVALSIDGDAHESLLDTYTTNGDLVTREQDSTYSKMYHYFKNIEVDAHLNSAIYTLFKENTSNDIIKFYYGVNSSDDMPDKTFREAYKLLPHLLISNYTTGASIPAYETKNGCWISVFHPFKNSKGEVVGLVKVDENFNTAISRINQQVLWSVCVSAFFISILASFLIRSARRTLIKEKELTIKQ